MPGSTKPPAGTGPGGWQRIEELYHSALKLAPEERPAFLDKHCADNPAVRSEVESLLDYETARGGVSLNRPALDVAARLIKESGEADPLIGGTLGNFKVLEKLGAGGMGVVYRARDTRLRRDVAIKVLPAGLASDASLKQRLEHEARAVSKLSHPHICALHDIGRQGGVDFLVMEYLKGETLEQRLRKGRLPTELMLRYAEQIAGALAEAHKLGITHRDLKPANVMLTKSGAKLMDFGLAKQSRPTPLAQALNEMTTEQSTLTGEGDIIGTIAYMAPEQLEGKEADARSDIFALGEVIYEMATGKRAFSGASRANLIAAILTTDPPPMIQLQPLTPPALEHVVRKCLARDPDERWQSARDLASELNWISTSPQSGSTPAAPVKTGYGAYIPWLVAGVALALAAGWTFTRFRPQPKPATYRLQIAPPEKSAFGFGLALSPDGSQFCFATTSESAKSPLTCRALNSTQFHALAGTEGARFPFFSPDGAAVAFFAGGKLKKVDLASGSVQVLADAEDPRGGDWGRNGDIIFTPSYAGPVYRVAVSGGAATAATTIEHEVSDRWPHFLPDGKRFLYFSRSVKGVPEDKIVLATVDSKETREFMTASSGVTVIPGYVLFLRSRTLFAQRFDEGKAQLAGEPMVLAEGVEPEGEGGPTSYAPFAVSQNGILAYLQSSNQRNQLTWFDRSGKRLEDIGPVGSYDGPSLSADGTRLAVDSGSGGSASRGIYVLDLARGTFTRFYLSTKSAFDAIWSPDGKEIVFSATDPNGGGYAMYRKASSGAGPEELLPGTGPWSFADNWSRDGRYLIYEITVANRNDLWVLPMYGEQKPFRYLPSVPYSRSHAAFSPDGRWVSYTSEESGWPEIYVQSFPDPHTKLQISTDGGDQAVWSDDGKELFYIALNSSLVSVPVDTRGVFRAGRPHPLFTAPMRPFTGGASNSPREYQVSRDGRRFLINTMEQRMATAPLTAVVNWTAELKK